MHLSKLRKVLKAVKVKQITVLHCHNLATAAWVQNSLGILHISVILIVMVIDDLEFCNQ